MVIAVDFAVEVADGCGIRMFFGTAEVVWMWMVLEGVVVGHSSGYSSI